MTHKFGPTNLNPLKILSCPVSGIHDRQKRMNGVGRVKGTAHYLVAFIALVIDRERPRPRAAPRISALEGHRSAACGAAD